MAKQALRRLPLALILAVATGALTGTAHAGITGTDPCPKGWYCAVQSSSASSVGVGSAVQVALALFGLA